MAATPVNTQWVINEVAHQFLNKITLIKKADRTYDAQFKGAGARARDGGKVGSIVNARLPHRYRVASGAAMNKQPVNDQTTPVEITDQTNVGIELSTWTLSLEQTEIRRKVIQPAVDALVQDMEYKGFQRLYQKVPNSIGTLGTSPTANLTYSQGVAKLMDLSGNTDNLCAIVSSDQMAVIADAQKSYFTTVINPAFEMGQLPRAKEALGIAEWYASPNVASHTSGTLTTSTPLVNVAGGVTDGATSVVLDGGNAADVWEIGDVFTFANVFEVNSANYQSTGRLRQFTVTVRATGATPTINFTPAVRYSANGQYNNVNSLPADNAAVSLWGTAGGGSLTSTASRQGLIFAPDTFVFAMADAEEVDAPVCVFARDEEAGVSLRLTKSFDIANDNNLARIDAFWGWSAIRPEWTALRVQGA